MKNFLQPIALILAAGVAGVALFAFANSRFVAGLPVEDLLATGAAVALVRFAIYDYSRRVQPLAMPVRLLRPIRPAAARACYDNSLAA